MRRREEQNDDFLARTLVRLINPFSAKAQAWEEDHSLGT